MGEYFRRITTTAGPFSVGGMDLTFDYTPSSAERIGRDLQGRFTSARVEVAQELEGLAVKLQEMQVAALRDAVEATGREQRGTHYLEDAIMSPQNRTVTPDGFIVGNEAAFDESRAGPYWRGLEQGTDVHVGQRLHGLWITPGGFSPPIEGARDAIGFASWSGARAPKVPDDVAEDYRVETPNGPRLPGFQIKRGIKPYNYLQQGVEDFMASGAVPEAMQRALERALGVQTEAIERGISTRQVRAERRAARVSTAFQ